LTPGRSPPEPKLAERVRGRRDDRHGGDANVRLQDSRRGHHAVWPRVRSSIAEAALTIRRTTVWRHCTPGGPLHQTNPNGLGTKKARSKTPPIRPSIARPRDKKIVRCADGDEHQLTVIPRHGTRRPCGGKPRRSTSRGLLPESDLCPELRLLRPMSNRRGTLPGGPLKFSELRPWPALQPNRAMLRC
jgi:hypothetical protein